MGEWSETSSNEVRVLASCAAVWDDVGESTTSPGLSSSYPFRYFLHKDDVGTAFSCSDRAQGDLKHSLLDRSMRGGILAPSIDSYSRL